MEKLKMQTTNIVDENVKKIGELFPNCLTEKLDVNGKPEAAIDFDQLKQELSKVIVEGQEERYQFTWPDKRNAIRLANVPTTDTLRPCRKESVDFDNTQNLYIEGDNLEVLKILRENYLGKIKIIYIDPPYNTGNDFVYNDEYDQESNYYMHNSGQYDEEGNRLVVNTESNGRYHTDWLNMMYPRLKVAKDLLSDDGVIFISIDDNEVENLRKICDEIFGEFNTPATIIWEKADSPRMDAKSFSSRHDFILVYAKCFKDEVFKKPTVDDIPAHYDKIDDHGNRYYLKPLRYMGNADTREARPNLFFPIKAPNGELVYPKRADGSDGRWRWSKEKVATDFDRIEFIKGREGWSVYTRIYADTEATIPIETIWYNKDVGSNRTAMAALKRLFNDEKPFTTPKPIELIKNMLLVAGDKQSTVLDFFSGSATTAHSVMQLNSEDNGTRKFIMVQIPESTDKDSEAYKSGYKNICEIGKERIRRAGKQIIENMQSQSKTLQKSIDLLLHARPNSTAQLLSFDDLKDIAEDIYKDQILPKQKELEELEKRIERLDIGFRVLKLDSSNMQDVYYTPGEFTENDLFADNIKVDRTENDCEDLLFQAMIELGIELSAKIDKLSIAGKIVWNVNNGYLMACFDKDVNETTITEIAKLHPYYFIMRDSSMSTDNVADNFEQIWEEYSKDTIRRIL